MKRKLVATIVLSILAGSACMAQSPQLAPIPGLTEEIYYSLSGIWDSNAKTGQYSNSEEAMFSWGKGKYGPIYSVRIDLGAAEPYVKIYGNWFGITSIEKMRDGGIKLNLSIIHAPVTPTRKRNR